VLANQSQRRVAKGLAAPVIARTAALLRDQSLCATGVKCSTKPENLATADIHQRASGFRRERAIRQIDHHAQPGQLPLAHPNHRHRTTPQTSRRQLVPVTSQSGTRVTSLSMTYRRVPPSGRYGKSGRQRSTGSGLTRTPLPVAPRHPDRYGAECASLRAPSRTQPHGPSWLS